MPENTTKLFAVVGDPIAHSLSPAMHTAAIGALHLDARFVALRTTQKAFPSLVKELLEGGGGCSVTRPFKDDAFALTGHHTEAARRTRAVNCISGPADHPILDNTDVIGIVGALVELVGTARVRTVRIFGTGGAARAAVVAMAQRDPETQVRIVSRRPSRALEFVQWSEDEGLRCEVAPPAFECHEEIYINAAPSVPGLPTRDMDEPPDPEHPPGRPEAYLDLNYDEGGRAAREVLAAFGASVADGRAVLLHQGVAAFERFFGVNPPVEVMRRAIEEALAT